MEILLAHWHCILPVLGIVVAMFFMRDKDKEKKGSDDSGKSAGIKPDDYNE